VWRSVRLSGGFRLRVPGWLAWLVVSIAVLALVVVAVVDVVGWLITVPSRLAAAVTGGSERVIITPVDIIRLDPQCLAIAIRDLEDDGGFVEDVHFHAAHPRARRWVSADGETSLTVRYGAAGEPIDCYWQTAPGSRPPSTVAARAMR
jgi:hypothetical protein